MPHKVPIYSISDPTSKVYIVMSRLELALDLNDVDLAVTVMEDQLDDPQYVRLFKFILSDSHPILSRWLDDELDRRGI